MNFQEFCNLCPDFRRGQGMRINKDQLLTIIITAGVCGYFGCRPIERFAKAHEKLLTEMLGLKHGVPSHVTFSAFINNLESDKVLAAFNSWAKEQLPIQEGDLISFDGKCLASTVSNSQTSTQKYVAVVSMFCHRTQAVVLKDIYSKDKNNEIKVVENLLLQMKDLGVVFFGDALHCQKKL